MIKKYNSYEVSSEGKIYRNKKEIKTPLNSKGYKRIYMSENGKVKSIFVHRLVASLFIPNPDNLPQVNHIDGNKLNNNVENLEWCNNSQNQLHAIRNNLRKKFPKGDTSNRAKKIRMFNDKEDKTFNSFRSALEYLGKEYKSYTSISHCCKGDIKTAFGYHWEYVE